jgi:very-short-patch-repair endonuclease
MPRKITTEIFIGEAKEKHGDKYDYSKTIYIDWGTKVTIICPTHGEFQQTPQCHISCGCPLCNKQKKFIENVEKIYGNETFNCKKVIYKDAKTPVILIINETNEFIKYKPRDILKRDIWKRPIILINLLSINTKKNRKNRIDIIRKKRKQGTMKPIALLINSIRCHVPWFISFINHPLFKYLHPNKNNAIDLNNIGVSSEIKLWFYCDICEHDFQKAPVEFRGKKEIDRWWCPYCSNKARILCSDENCKFCYDHSIASHTLSKYWHPTKNGNITPREIRGTDVKFWFLCPHCPHEHCMRWADFIKSKGCSYASNHKRCNNINCLFCLFNSFSGHPLSRHWHPTKNGKIKPRNISMQENKSYWFLCPDCNHSIQNTPNKIYRRNKLQCKYCNSGETKCEKGENCDVCFKNSFASHPMAKRLHPTKNGNINPRYISKCSMQEFYFICKNNSTHIFNMSLPNISRSLHDNYCPICINKTETIIYDFLLNNISNFGITNDKLDQYKTDWCINQDTNKHLPYDFYIELENGKKIIIECDGEQHYIHNKHFHRNSWSLEKQKDRDIYKMNKALENGVSMIRIYQEEVYKNIIDWKNEITDAINDIKNENEDSIKLLGCLKDKIYWELE